MKYVVPAIVKAKIYFADPPKNDRWLHQISAMALAILTTILVGVPAYSQIIDDGSVNNINFSGGVQDLTIPNNSQIVAISFDLTGGDGGYARVHDSYINPLPPFNTINVSHKSSGGAGANTIATFPVGNGPGEIPLGSTVRFVVGGAGSSGNSGGALGVGLSYGGGGGGSAVLYNPPGPAGWTLLAVAGGGGGAYQGMFAYSAVDSESGQGGRASTSGGSGNGDVGVGSGGSGGSGGGDGGLLAVAGAGGGANSAGGGITCVSFMGSSINGEGGAGGNSMGYGGWSEGCTSFSWSNGGAGYGGGGAGSGAAGGGGGYSGGGAGGSTGRGGGGGSYVNPIAQPGSSKTNGGTDGSPDHGSISYLVTLNQPPVAQCKAATIYLDANGNASLAADDIDDGSSDPDGTITNIAVSKSNFTCADLGANQVTLTVTDNNGATDDCQATVTVVDTISPQAVCQDITVYLDANGQASITADEVDGGSTDNCSIDSRSIDVSSFTCADVGSPVSVTLTVEDPSGNTDQCQATVTVLDTVSPLALCQDITVQLDATGNALINPGDVDNGSSDACGIKTMSVSPTSFTCADVDNPVTVTLTVTDNNDNVSTCTSVVTVEDNVPPEAICQNITIQLDEQGEASIGPTDVDGGSNDACGIGSFAVNKTDFTCGDLGSNTVTLTVTDVNGNSATCDATVTVEDNIIPIVRTRNVTVVLDENGEGNVTVSTINNGSTDNCSIVAMWLEGETDYDCGNTGTHEVVLKARDQSGNIGSMNAFVTVKFYEPDFKNIHGVANGDTIHIVDCQVPWQISRYDLNYDEIIKHGTLKVHSYRAEVPENAPWGMYKVWRYEYVVEDACAHTYTFNFYLAMYDLAPPVYQCFPRDTTVATAADVPPVDPKVKIIDVCQYVVWDTVMTMPVLDISSGDTLGFTRRWMARDPSGHESFQDQMIWLGSGDRKQYSMITGRIADEDHVLNAKFAGEAGTNGLPVSLYRLDVEAGTRTHVSSWTTGDWLGAQGTYYFLPEHPGQYQVKIDTAICLIDTLKFNKQLWSDTLTVAAGESVDQGWVLTESCLGNAVIHSMATERPAAESDIVRTNEPMEKTWDLYPNPARGYLKLNIQSDEVLDYLIYDALGRAVKSGQYQQGKTIDVHGLNTGLYHLQLREQNQLLGTKRVLVISDY